MQQGKKYQFLIDLEDFIPEQDQLLVFLKEMSDISENDRVSLEEYQDNVKNLLKKIELF